MPTFSSLKEMEKYIQDKINVSLEKDVAPVVKEIMSAEVQNTVYAEYPNPRVYERRLNKGGLMDINNMNDKLVTSGILSITNDTPFNPEYNTVNSGDGLAGLVEFGHGRYNGIEYDYPSDERFTNPRPFIEATREDLIQTQAHTKALINGLKKSGIKFT